MELPGQGRDNDGLLQGRRGWLPLQPLSAPARPRELVGPPPPPRAFWSLMGSIRRELRARLVRAGNGVLVEGSIQPGAPRPECGERTAQTGVSAGRARMGSPAEPRDSQLQGLLRRRLSSPLGSATSPPASPRRHIQPVSRSCPHAG